MMEEKWNSIQVPKNDRSIQEVLAQYVDQKKISGGYYNAEIQEVWKNRMGNSIQKHTLELTFKKGKLFVTLDSAPLKQELSLNKDKLLAVINNSLSSPVVKEIFIN